MLLSAGPRQNFLEEIMNARGDRFLAVTADVQVKAGKGILRKFVITTLPSTGGAITLYDSLTETGTVIATITIPTAANGGRLETLDFDVNFATGLYVGYDGTIVAARGTVTFD